MKRKLYDFRNIVYDVGRVFIFLHIIILFRPKYIYEDGNKSNKKLIGKSMVIANHKKWVDALVLMSVFIKRRLIFPGAKEIYENPIMRKAMPLAGCIKIDREKVDYASVKKMIRTIKEHKPLVMFPEGEMLEHTTEFKFKNGISLLAYQTKAIITPVYIGEYKLFGRLHIYIGNPIDTTEFIQQNTKKDILESLTKALEQKMTELRRMDHG